MDLKCFVAICLLVNVTIALNINTHNIQIARVNDDFNGELESVTLKNLNTLPTVVARYEVTENIIDVPNTSPNRGLVNTSFVLTRPLNQVISKPINEIQPDVTTSVTIENEPNLGPDKKPTENKTDGNTEIEKMYKSLENNYYSILQVIQTHHNENEKIERLPHFLHDFKDYLDGLRRGFVHGIHSGKEEGNRPNFFRHPFNFFNKIFKGRERSFDFHDDHDYYHDGHHEECDDDDEYP